MKTHLGLHNRSAQILERVNWHPFHMWGTNTYPRKQNRTKNIIKFTKWSLRKQISGATRGLLKEKQLKQVFGTTNKTLDKCTIKTWSHGNCKMITRKLISKRPLGNWKTNNCLATIRRLKHKQSLDDHQTINGQTIA